MIRPNDQTHQPLVIYGAGGHGRVVAEAAHAAGWRILGFLDDYRADDGDDLPWPLLSADDRQLNEAAYIVAVGDNAARHRIGCDLDELGRTLAVVVHPAASVSPTAMLHPGAFVGPKAVVHTDAELSHGVIVNSGAIVEHDGRIGACAHIAPGAALGGRCVVGDRTLVGLNAAILPGCAVGCDCRIGAGAVVTRPIPDGRTVAGVPARDVE